MTLLRPEWLLLLPLIALWYRHSRREVPSNTAWERHFDRDLLTPLLGDGAASHPWLNRLRWGAVFLLPLALAGPALTDDERVGEPLSPVLIVLSQSPSMQHNDLTPSRYQRAASVVEQWLSGNPGRPAGLIAYSGSAHLIAPPTADHNTLRLMINQLSPDIMPVAGRASHDALTMAIERARRIGADILWLTDHPGNAQPRTLPAMPGGTRFEVIITAQANASGPVREANGNIARTASGQALLADPEPDGIRALAAAASGDWQWQNDLTARLSTLLPPRIRQTDDNNQRVTGWHDLGPYLFLAVLPGLMLQLTAAGSMGVLLVLTSAVFMAQPADANDSWWLNRDQRAVQRLNDSPAEAADLFTQPHWQAYASLVAEQPREALAALGADTSAWGAYHRGLALTQLGQYDEALAAFETAVDERPGWSAAINNRDLLREWLQGRTDNNNRNNPNASEQRQTDQRTETGEPAGPSTHANVPSPGAGSTDRERDQRAAQRLPPPDRTFMERKLRYQWEQQRAR